MARYLAAMAESHAPAPPVVFQTSPDRYRHIRLSVDGAIARILLDVQEDGGLRPGYVLKLNSYDLGVDIELADAVQRLRFEHPEVSCVVISSAKEGIFSSGANIFMLSSSSHAFKVNFCKYTNETRLSIEDASQHSGQRYVAALNGIASGGGYELPLACEEIYLVDDRRSAVALPEVPYLGVLPGTGGLTRVVDKRRVRRDRADVFCTLAEGIKGRRAKDWGLVDEVFPTTRFQDGVQAKAVAIAGAGHPECAGQGVHLDPIVAEQVGDTLRYRHVTLSLDKGRRMATLCLRGPSASDVLPERTWEGGADLWALRAFRELDDAILQLRFNHLDIGLVLLRTEGDAAQVLRVDAELLARKDWFAREIRLYWRRTLKRLDLSAKTVFALIEGGSCFAGSLVELALAADRIYMQQDGPEITLSDFNFGPLPMGNGLTRLQSRFYGDATVVDALQADRGPFDGARAEELGLATASFDDVDWDDEIRLATEERVSLSPDALTGMEASLRFVGPETLETKIFGRLSAWQNWIFQRPNAVGPRGALTLYGQPETATYDWNRT